MSQILNDFRTNATIQNLRTEYSADLCFLVTNRSDISGIGYLLENPSGLSGYAFAIANYNRVRDTYTLAHETGHNLGARHDTLNDNQGTYNHGFRYTSGQWCTIMSYYTTETRQNFWSNPDKTFQGVTRGDANYADNSRKLSETKGTVSLFRSPQLSGTLANNQTLSGRMFTLTGNLTVPSGKTLTIKSTATLNLNNFYIVSSGGTVTKETGATINGLSARLLAGSYLKGLFPTIQGAVNSWTSGRTVKIEEGTFNENYITVNNKDGIYIRGQGVTKTYLTKNLTIINSDNVHVYYMSFTGNGNLYLSNCSGFWVTCNFSNDSWYAPLSMYASSGNFYGLINNTSYTDYYGIDAEYSGDVYIVDESEIKNHNIGLNVYDGSWFYIEYVLFCDNTYDAGTDGSSYIQAGGNEWSGDPFETTFGYVGGISHNDPVCNAQKRNVTKKHNGINTSNDPAYDDFIIVSNEYSNLLKTIHSENKNNGEIDITRYADQFRVSINDFNEFIKSNTASVFAKTSLNIIVQILQRLNDYDGMKAYLTEIINDKNLSSLNAFAKQYMVTYYNHNQNYTSALSTADEILNAKDIDESTICNALYSKELINEYSFSNKDEAIKDFSTIVNNYPEEPLSRFAKRELSKLGVDIDNDQRQNVTHQQENLKFTTSSYPNPFNPTTTINYTLPTDELVVLKVYDILGREVTTLVNEVKQAGSYSISFNASNLASGIYIYTISAGNFSQTKKMLLLR